MTQHIDELEAYRDEVNQLRNHLWVLHGALELQESFVKRLERQADNPDDCNCSIQVFATIDGFDGPGTSATVCKLCHDKHLASQPYTYKKPGYLIGRQ